jgi:two-component system, OmpR family, response regulator
MPAVGSGAAPAPERQGDQVTEKISKILHVEDDLSLQNLVRIALERLGGYSVCTAPDGFQAVTRAREFVPDLILLDLDLPGRDGVATLALLREVDGLGEVPVVFLTAAGDAQVRARLLSLGAREVLGKPFRPRELVRAVARVLEAAAA